MEEDTKTERQDGLLARTLKFQMSQKIDRLQYSLINTNTLLGAVRKRKCIANARTREAATKMNTLKR